MRTCFDSVNVNDLPADGDLYLGYRDGAYANYGQVTARFPGKTVIGVTVFASDDEGDMLDVETGDATAVQAPGWVTKRRNAGHPAPLVYTYEMNRQAVLDAFTQQNVPLPGLFIAAFPGSGAALQQPTDVGHQYGQGGDGAYDISVVVDYLPGIDPAPPLPPEAEMASALVYAPPGQGPGEGGPASLFYLDTAGHLQQVYWAPHDGGNWAVADLTKAAGAPAAAV